MIMVCAEFFRLRMSHVDFAWHFSPTRTNFILWENLEKKSPGNEVEKRGLLS